MHLLCINAGNGNHGHDERRLYPWYSYFLQTLPYVALAVLLLHAAPSRAASVRLEHSTASLLSAASAVQPGQTFRTAIRLELDEGWHVYWKNPGDSGLPISLNWALPDGAQAGDILWLPPERLPLPPLMNYGFKGTAYYPVRITVPDAWPEGQPFPLRVRAEWLICADICIPESAELALSLPVSAGEPVQSTHAEEVERAFARYDAMPVWDTGRLLVFPEAVLLELPEWTQRDTFVAESLDHFATKHVYFYPETEGLIRHEAAQEKRIIDAKVPVLEAALAIPRYDPDTPLETETVRGILEWREGDTPRYARIQAAVKTVPEGVDISRMAKPLRPGGMQAKTPEDGGTGMSFLTALALAFLGGLILNAMPCVFPVLSLKALAITKKAGHDLAAVRVQGLAYTAGVLLSFALVAGVLLALKHAGAAAGWGYQMQSPAFVTLLVWILSLVTFNLAGAFELPSLHALPGMRAASRQDTMGAFATGVLAVVVATPCTAPFMAPALGYALTRTAVEALTVFLALGAGFAAPYLAISFLPPLLRLLPKPGAWMVTFRQFLAFPMALSVVWLLWVFAQLAGLDRMILLLCSLVGAAAGLWAGRRWPERRLQRWLVWIVCAGIPLYLALSLPSARMEPIPGMKTPVVMEPFSRARLEALRAEGTPVFVNATAAWCITCKLNERLALRSDAFRNLLRERNITYLIADWTDENAEISAWLSEFGRSGVPLYVYYPPEGEPRVLPQLLTASIVASSLRKAP